MIITGYLPHFVLLRKYRSTVKPSARGRLTSRNTKMDKRGTHPASSCCTKRDCCFAILEYLQVDLKAHAP